MKKLITGVLVLALTFTFAFPVFAETSVKSTEDSETTVTDETSKADEVKDVIATKEDFASEEAYNKHISEQTTKVNTVVQKKDELKKVTELLKKAGVDTKKKTIAKSPTVVQELKAPAGISGLAEWSLPEKSLKITALGTGQFVLAHLRSDNTMEYQVINAKEGVIQEKLLFHGASPIAFYKVTDLTAATTKSHKTGASDMALLFFAISTLAVAVAGKKAFK